MYNAMKKLIGRRFYAAAGQAQEKLDVFFAVGRLTAEQYTELSALVGEVYAA
jgi:hypothetical protein